MAKLINTATPRERLLCPDLAPTTIDRRYQQLRAPHIRPLTEWVETVRRRLDPCHASTVANFDPVGGGTNARVMYLAQDPSTTANGTGFISPDNNDPTARATTEACDEAGIAEHERIHWNVYPWYLAADCAEPVPNRDELATTFLVELLGLLPEVRSVVLIGDPAAKSWARLAKRGGVRSGIEHWAAPHPSYGWWAKPYKPKTDGRLGRDVVVDALRQARAHAYGD